jgi:hypothetical protein
MTATVIASYTPTVGRPQGFAVASTAVSLVVNNQSAMRLQLFIGRAGLANVAPQSQALIPSLIGQAFVMVTPDALVQSYGNRGNTGIITITSYASGDALPPGSSTEIAVLTPHSGMTHNALERLRGGLELNVRDFGAQGDGVTDDAPPVLAALDLARIIGGARVYGPAGTYLLDSATTNAEVATLAAALWIGDNTTLIGDGPGLSVFKAGPNLLRQGVNALIRSLYPAPLRELYVAKTGADVPGGGSRTAPYLTIAYAATQVTGPGTVIHVAPGNYSEAQINCTTAGTILNPNMILSDVPWGAKITSTASGPVSRGFQLDSQSWWVVGCDITGVNLQAGGIAHNSSYCYSVGNYLHQCGRTSDGDGINISDYNSTGQVIVGNVVLECGAVATTQGHGIYWNGNGPIICNNLVVHCDGAGIHTYHHGSNAIISNNTIVACGAGGGLAGILMGIGNADTLSGCYVANNLITNNTNYGIKEYQDTGGSVGANTYTNNGYFANTVGRFLPIAGNTSINEQTTDPLYINYQASGSGGDYRLSAGSPAIANGISSGSLPATFKDFDIHGNARPGAGNDIGCFQAVAWGGRYLALLANYNPATGNNNLAVQDLTLDGGANTGGGQLRGLSATFARRVRALNVNIRNVPGGWSALWGGMGQNEAAAVQVDRCSDVTFSLCTVYSDDGGPMADGYAARFSVNVAFEQCSAYGLGGAGFFADSCYHVRHVSCASYSNTGQGYFAYKCQDIRYEKSEAGLLAPPIAGNGFTASQALGNTWYGFEYLASVAEMLSCLSVRNGQAGIAIDGQSTLTGSDVICRNNNTHGLQMLSSTIAGGRVLLQNFQSNNNTQLGAQLLTAFVGQVALPRYRATGNTTAPLQASGANYATVTGSMTAPGVPATTVALTSPFPFDMMVEVTGGTVTVIALDGTTTGRIVGLFRVRAGGTITLTYTVAPTWVWFSEN